MPDKKPLTQIASPFLYSLVSINDQYQHLDRAVHQVIDSNNNVDPLLDKCMDRIQAITAYTEFTITTNTAGAPDYIAFMEYGNERLAWVIQVYNGLTVNGDFKEGTVVRIPSREAVGRALSALTGPIVRTKNVVEI